jgi:enoyl-CoA hydratase/carnithine racemase
MSYQYVRYQVQDHIATVTLDRPPVNALDFVLMDEILAALRQAGNDPEVRAIIVDSASQRIFCAGLDLKAIRSWSGHETKRFVEKIYTELYDVQCRLGKPTVAAMRGAARGGGITIGLQCDLMVAGENSSFSYSEIHVGLIPAIHLIHLPRLIGRYRAFDVLFNGTTFGPQEALQMGLVSRVVADDEVPQAALQLAHQLASRSPLAMQIGRDLFKEVNDYGFRDALAKVIDGFAKLSQSEDAHEGFQAFAEKRAPQWKGR